MTSVAQLQAHLAAQFRAAEDSGVFPAQMIAECPQGHRWLAAMTWHLVLRRGSGAPDPRVRVPSAQPAYCAECFLATRMAVAASGFHHVEPSTAGVSS